MKKIILILISFTVFCACEVKINTNSKSKKEEASVQNIPFPVTSNYTKEELVNLFWKCNYNSAGITLEYWVILPKDVKPTQIEPVVMGGKLTNIGQYSVVDKKSNYMEIWVFYETVDESTQPCDWLIEKLKINGENILNQSIINTSNSERYLDALTSKMIENGEKVISRFTVVKSGMNYFFIKAACNEKDYIFLAEKMRHITSNWGIKN